MSTLAKILIYLFLLNSYAQSTITSESIALKNDSILLPGALTYNKTLSQQPLVIFVHGSGNVDRNGNQAGVNIRANYIKQLADSLNTRGIAFYRYDKRTATPANMKHLLKGTNLDSFVDDVAIAVNKFKNDTRFSSITLIGHSQGSTVAMLAAQNNEVNKYVSLAGLSRKFEDFIIDEFTKASEEFGAIAARHFKELHATGSIKEVHPQLAHIFPKQNIPFLLNWMQYDPSLEIQKLNIPILLINGTKDIQVFPMDAEKLHKANPNSTLVIIKDMNHVLKTILKDEDNQKSYFSPDYPLSNVLINALTTFIKK